MSSQIRFAANTSISSRQAINKIDDNNFSSLIVNIKRDISHDLNVIAY